MTTESTYLEFSEANESSHKFYEVIVKGTELTIRYGRIGQKGRLQTTLYPNPEMAKLAADKKVKEKLKKGYRLKVKEEDNNTPIEPIKPEIKPNIPLNAPLIWQFNTNASAFGIFIDENACWVGNEKGKIYQLNHQGEVVNQYQLPKGVKCIVADDLWIYAGCDDGNVYDLSGKLLYLAYEIDRNIDIYWLDIYDGILTVSDANGGVVKIDAENESQWTRLSQGKQGWMVRCDEKGIYHGYSNGVTMYDRQDGRQLWYQKTRGKVLFGCQTSENLYIGTSGKFILRLNKQGEEKNTYFCDASVFSCATSEGEEYIFAGDNTASIYCFKQTGERLWKMGTNCGSALSMQYFDEKLYLVTTNGTLACMDGSKTAIESAIKGKIPQVKEIELKTTQSVASITHTLEKTQNSQQGVKLECVKIDNKLRIKVLSEGYHSDWFVQFPRNLRHEGANYLVEGIKEASQGGFYRAYGEIKQLEDS